MPVIKYRSLEEAEQDLWNLHPDDEYYRRLAGFYSIAGNLVKHSHPPGVFPFKNIDEARRFRTEHESGV